MEELINNLRILQSNAFIYYTKAHGYHWNVEGILFNQFHSFFGDLYEDIYGSIDEWAEWIRRFDEKAVFDVLAILSTSNIKYDLVTDASNPLAMLSSLLSSNNQMLIDLKSAFSVATSANEQGAANYIAERIDAHEKWGWKIKASLRSMGSN